MSEKRGFKKHRRGSLEEQISRRSNGVCETIESIKSGKNKSLSLEKALEIERLLEGGSNDSEIRSALNINPDAYKSYTDPDWYEKRMDGIRDYCIRNNIEITAETCSYKELKHLAYLKGIDETIERIKSGKSKQNLDTANNIKRLLENRLGSHKIASALGISPETCQNYTNPKRYDDLRLSKAHKRDIEINQDGLDRRGIKETIRRIRAGENRQSLQKAMEIQNYLMDGLSPRKIQEQMGLSSVSYRDYVNPSIAVCLQKCFPSRRQEEEKSALNHLEALSHWNKYELETGAGLSLYELNLMHGPNKEDEIPLNEYLDRLVRLGVLRYSCLGEEEFYSVNTEHSFVQRLIKTSYFDGYSTRLNEGIFDELRQEALWKQLCNSIYNLRPE